MSMIVFLCIFPMIVVDDC